MSILMIFATEFGNDVDFKFIVILAINVTVHLVGKPSLYVYDSKKLSKSLASSY